MQAVLTQFMQDEANFEKIDAAAALAAEAIAAGGKLLSCGNGGSMADAVHFAEELTGRFRDDRPALPAIAISDAGHLSCVSNDYGYEQVFMRYIEALGKPGDLLLAISTSGNSQNVIRAAELARVQQMHVIALTGNAGGQLKNFADIELRVPHVGYADRIQEVHIKIIHLLIEGIEHYVAQPEVLAARNNG